VNQSVEGPAEDTLHEVAGRSTATAALKRIQALDAEIKAFVHFVDAASLRPKSVGPLAGHTVGVKDVLHIDGMPTRAGSSIPAATPRSETAAVVSRLRRAGASVVGKTNTHEFAFGAVTPPTRNPRDLRRIPGGSSGGSAAAVAAGMVSLAVGTDTGGSIRLPAALCGVFGIRLRRATVAFDAGIPLAPSYDAVGLMAASLSDLVAACRAVDSAGAGSSDPTIGIPEIGERMDDHVGAAFQLGMDALPRCQAVRLPSFGAWFEPRMAIQMREALAVHRQAGWWPNHEDDYSLETRRNLTVAETIRDTDCNVARRELARLEDAVHEVLDRVDVVLTPTVPHCAPTYEEVAAMSDEGGRRHPIVSRLSIFTLPFSTHDLASLSVPVNVPDALPTGLQLVGRSEAAVLQAAKRLLDGLLAHPREATSPMQTDERS